jgi:hypothetical protein
MKMVDTIANIAKNYTEEISRLHGIPKEIVSNRDTQFTSNLSRGLFKGFGKILNFSTTYHPK